VNSTPIPSLGGDVTHNRLGLNQASGNFKKQRQCGAHWPHMVCQKEQSSRTQGLEAGNLGVAAAVPGDRHAFRQGDTLVSPLSFTGASLAMILWGSVLIREREANRTRVPGLQYPGHQPGKGAAGLPCTIFAGWVSSLRVGMKEKNKTSVPGPSSAKGTAARGYDVTRRLRRNAALTIVGKDPYNESLSQAI